LSKIERKFRVYRERFLDDQISHYDTWITALKNEPRSLPDFQAMMKSIEERRDEAMRKNAAEYEFKLQAIFTRIKAERHQLMSQWFQTVRDIRETALEKCNKRLFQLQKERRRAGTDSVELPLLYNPKKAEQIRQHNARSKEVALLSGIKRYRGFPAAPEITGLTQDEIDADLRAMGVSSYVISCHQQC
jgi:hypothetical protein